MIEHHARRTIARALALRPAFTTYPPHSPGEQLKVGYISSDLGAHITGRLVRSLFALHDRRRVRVHVYTGSSDDGSDVRQQVIAAADVHVCGIVFLMLSNCVRCYYGLFSVCSLPFGAWVHISSVLSD